MNTIHQMMTDIRPANMRLLHAPGEITHTFGTHEYTVRFTEAPGASVSLHMKECWFTRA